MEHLTSHPQPPGQRTKHGTADDPSGDPTSRPFILQPLQQRRDVARLYVINYMYGTHGSALRYSNRGQHRTPTYQEATALVNLTETKTLHRSFLSKHTRV